MHSLKCFNKIHLLRWPPNTWNVNNAPPPNSKRSLYRLKAKFRAHGTLQDRRKKRASAREGQEERATPAKVAEVSANQGF